MAIGTQLFFIAMQAFFHSHATQRRRRNQINKLQNESGRETKDVQEMKGIARAYFKNLFITRRTTFNEHLFSGINHCIFDEDNRKLVAPYNGGNSRGSVQNEFYKGIRGRRICSPILSKMLGYHWE